MKINKNELIKQIKDRLLDPNKYDSEDCTPPDDGAGQEEWMNYIFSDLLPYAVNMAIGIIDDMEEATK